MDNIQNNDVLQVRPAYGKCPGCGDEAYEWQCNNGNKIYTAPTIEAAIQQAPPIQSDKTYLKICSENACGQTNFLVSSNHPKGGDAGHGGVTVLCIQIDAMDMSLDVEDDDTGKIQHFERCSFRLTVRGDEEFRALLNGLIASVEVMKRRERIEAKQFEHMKQLNSESTKELAINKESLKSIFTEEAQQHD